MKFTREERLAIGKRIYEKELTVTEASIEYDVNVYTARDYLRIYKAAIKKATGAFRKEKIKSSKPGIDEYKEMSKEELIDELIKAKINEARAKKGYMVKGGGSRKEYLVLSKKNTK